jgi:ABC-type uncharacterized transport system substrate-binding protein
MSTVDRAFLFVIAIAVAPMPANSQIGVEAKEQLVFDQGKLSAVRQIWRFDAAYSAFATTGLDTSDANVLDSELAPLAAINVNQLAQFGFFTSLIANGENVDFAGPTDYRLEFQDGNLSLFYTLPLKRPFEVHGRATLEIFDPQHVFTFNFATPDRITLDGAPARCRAVFLAPSLNSTIISGAPGAPELSSQAKAAGSILANRIVLDC